VGKGTEGREARGCKDKGEGSTTASRGLDRHWKEDFTGLGEKGSVPSKRQRKRVGRKMVAIMISREKGTRNRRRGGGGYRRKKRGGKGENAAARARNG